MSDHSDGPTSNISNIYVWKLVHYNSTRNRELLTYPSRAVKWLTQPDPYQRVYGVESGTGIADNNR